MTKLVGLFFPFPNSVGAHAQTGALKSSARVVQLFGRLATVETHTLWYFGHHCCLVVGFDALGIWHFWIFTRFTHFYLFAHIFCSFPPHFSPPWGPREGKGDVANLPCGPVGLQPSGAPFSEPIPFSTKECTLTTHFTASNQNAVGFHIKTFCFVYKTLFICCLHYLRPFVYYGFNLINLIPIVVLLNVPCLW